MTDARGKEEGICAGPGLSHEPLWDGGSDGSERGSLAALAVSRWAPPSLEGSQSLGKMSVEVGLFLTNPVLHHSSPVEVF